MYSRLITVALLLFLALAAPVSAYAAGCESAVLFFEDDQEVLNIISLQGSSLGSNDILIFFFRNNGQFVANGQLPIGDGARVSVTGQDLYATNGNAPPLKHSYVKISLGTFQPTGKPTTFRATLTRTNGTHEVGCIDLNSEN